MLWLRAHERPFTKPDGLKIQIYCVKISVNLTTFQTKFSLIIYNWTPYIVTLLSV